MTDTYIGTEIGGQFRIVEKIGAGGMSTVYKAEQPDMNRHVAIKILHSKYLSRPDLVARFRREARAMSQLSHPNTARVFLYGQLDDGACYFVMEHLEGKNLAKLIRRTGGIDAARAVRIMTQICYALEEAHRAGIVHRDIKPENIFLTSQGGIDDFPKVLDFGLAKVTQRQMRPESLVLTQQGMVFGTPEFMSPEQAHGKTLDARSDNYSLGVVLYELLTGKLPFDAKQPLDFIRMHVKESPIPMRVRRPDLHFSALLDAAVMRALEKDPDKRFQTAVEFALALDASVSGEGREGGASVGQPPRQPGQPSDGPVSVGGASTPAMPPPLVISAGGARDVRSSPAVSARSLASVPGPVPSPYAAPVVKQRAPSSNEVRKPIQHSKSPQVPTAVWVVVSMFAGAAFAWMISALAR